MAILAIFLNSLLLRFFDPESASDREFPTSDDDRDFIIGKRQIA